MRSMHARVCNRELFKWYLALKKNIRNQEESKEEVTVDCLSAKNVSTNYRAMKVQLMGQSELNTEWTTSKDSLLGFSIEQDEMNKFLT